jgi:uncharacterized protein with von Willebrand factor type A (vWA) domain
MQKALHRFIRHLRNRGLTVSPGEHLDALAAVERIPWEDRAAFREALRATLVKRPELSGVFEEEFARFFAPPPLPTPDGKGKRGAGGQRPSQEGRNARGDSPGEERSQGQHSERERPDKPSEAESEADRRRGEQRGPQGRESTIAEEGPGEEPGARGREGQTGAHSEHPQRVTFRGDRPPGAERSVEQLARAVLRGLSPAQVQELRRQVRIMARRLAARLSRRRRASHRGPVDLKRTLRASLQYGGVPMSLRHRSRRRDRPQIVVLCDVSGSVLQAAELMLEFLRALYEAPGDLRVFGFTNRAALMDEALARPGTDLRAAVHGAGLDPDAFSDFGGACYDLLGKYPGAITRRTTLVVMGDARNNYGDAMAWAFAELAGPAKKVVWLVPEPRERWGTGDSQIAQYVGDCDVVAECHTLQRLLRALAKV